MNTKPDHRSLCSEIQNQNFTCIRCGLCCRETDPGSNLVMVSPVEVRSIMAATSLSFDEVAEPYPDTIRERDREYTLGWAIRREGDHCRFLVDGMCTVYKNRPWICRTYPFMINNGRLIVSPCSGIGSGEQNPREPVRVDIIASDLLKRQKAEEEEEFRITEIMARETIPFGRMIVVDSEGIRIIHG